MALARAIDSGKSSYTDMIGVPGTLGFVAPEYFHTGRATRESDVFAFGAVVLETICGRRIACSSPAGSGQLLEWVWRLHGAGRTLEAVDPRLAGEFDEEDAARLLLLGLACSHPNAGERPRAKAILQNLTRSVPPFAVPLARPAFTWPVEPVVSSDGDAETAAMSRRTVTGTVVGVDPELASETGVHHGARSRRMRPRGEAGAAASCWWLAPAQQADASMAHLDMVGIKPRLSGPTWRAR